MRENLLIDGDYVPDGFGGFVRTQGDEKVLARALYKLNCKRGAFVFLPELGSKLSELGKEKPSAMEAVARQYCVQALEGMGVTVDAVRVRRVPERQAVVEVFLSYGQQKTAVEVTV